MEQQWKEAESSERGSGCQSGWTMYLGQSFEASLPLKKHEEGKGEEEEDLSMVSDASSGPTTHLIDEKCNHYCGYNTKDKCSFCYASSSSSSSALDKNESKRRKVEQNKLHQQASKKQEFLTPLEDTASSTILSFSKTYFSNDKKAMKTSMEGDLELSSSSATHPKEKTIF